MKDLTTLDFAGLTSGELDIALSALTALLQSETKQMEQSFQRYGGHMTEPDYATRNALLRALVARFGKTASEQSAGDK